MVKKERHENVYLWVMKFALKFTITLYIIFVACAFANSNTDENAKGNSDLILVDSRDSQEYKTVQIGTQTWMAENLNYAADESWCFTRFNFDCRKYGRFYDWNVAQNVCPAGWHLPQASEFEQLFSDVGGSDFAGIKLKSTEGWSHYGNGEDSFGFNATPSGFRDYRGRFDRQTLYAYLWSATEDSVSQNKKAIGVHMMAGRNDVSVYPYGKDFGLSVRCVKNKE